MWPWWKRRKDWAWYSAVLATFLEEAAGLQVFPLSREVKRDALEVLLRRLRTWSMFIINHEHRIQLAGPCSVCSKWLFSQQLTNDVGVDLHLSVLLRQLEGLIVAARQNQEVNGWAVVLQRQEKPAEQTCFNFKDCGRGGQLQKRPCCTFLEIIHKARLTTCPVLNQRSVNHFGPLCCKQTDF